MKIITAAKAYSNKVYVVENEMVFFASDRKSKTF